MAGLHARGGSQLSAPSFQLPALQLPELPAPLGSPIAERRAPSTERRAPTAVSAPPSDSIPCARYAAEVWMQTLLAEAIGTMMLVVLGDGVVANVVLTGTKGEKSGWIVITTGWGVAVAMAVYAVGRISGAHLNPAVTIALATIGSFSWAQVPGYHRRAAARRVRRRGHRLHRLPSALARDHRSRQQAGGLRNGAGHLAHRREPGGRDHRHRGAGLRHPRDRRQRADPDEAGRRRICPSSSAAVCSHCSWGSSCWASACHSAARPDMPSIRRATSAPASRTPFCRFPAKAAPTGRTLDSGRRPNHRRHPRRGLYAIIGF